MQMLEAAATTPAGGSGLWNNDATIGSFRVSLQLVTVASLDQHLNLSREVSLSGTRAFPHHASIHPLGLTYAICNKPGTL